MIQQNNQPTNQNLEPDINSLINNDSKDKKKNKFSLKNKFILIPLILIVVICLSYLGYSFINNNQTAVNSDSNNIITKQNAKNNFSRFNLVKPVFAQIDEMVSKIKPSVPYEKVTVNEIENLKSFFFEESISLTDQQKQALEDNGFFLVENDIIKDQSQGQDDFVDMYDAFDGSGNKFYRTQNNAVFITSDTALHLYHILIDRSFQKMEETKFQPMLRSMTQALFLDSINKYNSANDEKLKESYQRLSAYYLIPLVVLDAGSQSSGEDLKPEDFDTYAQFIEAVDNREIANSQGDLTFALDKKNYAGVELSDEIFQLAKSELELIQTAKGLNASPLFTPLRPEFTNDYSQFKPRSHYTKNDILKSYFISMMWYGRMGFAIKSPDLTRDALIMTGQINNLKVGDQELSKMWSDMSAVIDFFVGEVDDLTAYQYTDLIKKVYGDKNISDEYLADDKKLAEFIKKAKTELPTPKIVSEALAVFDDGGERDKLLADTQQFRFMGQRFTPDAYIINNLTQGAGKPDPETGQLLPTMPTALMPMHIIEPANQVIKNYLDAWVNDPTRIKQQNRQSDKIITKIINKLKQEFSNYNQQTWTQNIYWSWLNCFKPLLAGYGQGYPSFMQTDNWLKKNLGTALGSFTELKHDTLLYAKQSYAEFGAGGPDDPELLPPVVKGYVEPDLTFWNRIITLAETTEKGLKDRNVFPEEFDYKYKAFIDSAKFFKQIAEQELQNEKISDDDFENLRTISYKFRRIVAPIGNQELTKKEKRAGIIADFHTDAVNQQILYEATGKPFIIYVAVKDINGTRLTRGAVFNHYEFADTLDERLSDEDWQAKVYDNQGQLPINDKWSLELIK